MLVYLLLAWCGSEAVPMVAPLYVYKIKNMTSLNHGVSVRCVHLLFTIRFEVTVRKIFLLVNANDRIYYCRGDLLNA